MLMDARLLPAGAIIKGAVCIVGSGPAGLALATSLRKAGRRIILVESGGVAPDKEANDLASPGEQFDFGGLKDLSIHREVGGNSNAWRVFTPAFENGVRLLRFTEADFEARAAVPDSKWPVSRQELEPFYQDAARFFGINSLEDNPEPWLESGLAPLPLDPGKVRTSMYHFAHSPKLTRDYRSELEKADDVDVVYNATVVSLDTNESASHVSVVRALAAMDHPILFEASQVVLAAGGLFSTQILLNSDTVQTGGLGNQSGALGRYFNDHPIIDGGDLFPAPFVPSRNAPLYDMRSVAGDVVMGHLQLSGAVLKQEQVLNLSMLLMPRHGSYRTDQKLSLRQRKGLEALQTLKSAKLNAAAPAKLAADAVLGIDGVFKGGVDYLRHRDAKLNHGGWSARRNMGSREVFEVLHQAEQAPHHDNRIYLGKQRDSLGQRRICIDWRWHKEDQDRVMNAQDIYAREIAAAGVGTYVPKRVDGAPRVLRPSTGHYNSTTRMHADPKQGVVDRNCKVHGVDNLHVASCSTFPTGSFANPTLSIVAIALRIAEHLSASPF